MHLSNFDNFNILHWKSTEPDAPPLDFTEIDASSTGEIVLNKFVLQIQIFFFPFHCHFLS